MQTRTPNQNPVYLNGTIPDGTIYRFSPSITLLSESTSMNRNKIFPQPAQDHLMLSGIEPFDIGRGFKILDFKGRVGKVGSLRNNRIDISELSNGIYFLQLEGRLGSKTYKFIIQR